MELEELQLVQICHIVRASDRHTLIQKYLGDSDDQDSISYSRLKIAPIEFVICTLGLEGSRSDPLWR